jgi:hypothetical protein
MIEEGGLLEGLGSFNALLIFTFHLHCRCTGQNADLVRLDFGGRHVWNL